MKNKFWDKRIPTLLGVLLITLGVGLTTFFLRQVTFFGINASPTEQPQDVRITNITDTSFTVSYSTHSSVVGSINYGKDNNLGQTALDERDQQTVSSHKIHSIIVRSLNPQTQYFFTILSGKDTYLNNNQSFTVSTGPKISLPPFQQNPISGKIILPEGNSPNEAIIYLTAENSQVISALVKPDGSYLIPLNSLRVADLSSYSELSASSILKMLVFGDTLTSNAQFSFSEGSSVPTIILSKNYDFREDQAPISSASAGLENFPSFSSTSSASNKETPAIINPKQNQGLTDQQPEFKGTGLPNQKVEIIIHSTEQISTQVSTDSNGNWSYRPSAPLSPGTHTVTIVTKDGSGLLKTITQSFQVFASGQQVNPPIISGTPTPTIIPTATPTPIIVSPTLTATPTPTLAPVLISPTPTKKILPPTGNPSIITAGALGIVISLIGGLLFLLSRGSIRSI